MKQWFSSIASQEALRAVPYGMEITFTTSGDLPWMLIFFFMHLDNDSDQNIESNLTWLRQYGR